MFRIVGFMGKVRLAHRSYKLPDHDSFVWWALLAVSMLSLPTYVVVSAYGLPYHNQIEEILILALCCSISIYIGVHIHELLHGDSQFYYGRGRRRLQNILKDDFVADMLIENHLSEYDRYVEKINRLNENRYMTDDGVLHNAIYSRSSSHVSGD